MNLLCSMNSMPDYNNCLDLSKKEVIQFGNKAVNTMSVQEFRIKNDNPEVITIYGISK